MADDRRDADPAPPSSSAPSPFPSSAPSPPPVPGRAAMAPLRRVSGRGLRRSPGDALPPGPGPSDPPAPPDPPPPRPPVRPDDPPPHGGRPGAAPAAPAPSPAGPRPARPPRAVVADADWAATATVLAALRDRLLPRRRPWTWVRVVRAATATAAVLVVLVNGLAWGAGSWVEAAIRQIGALDPDSTSIVDAAAQQGDQNFLVVGSDTRVGALPTEDVGDPSDVPGARSDTVMVVHVPADRSRVTVISFPRDLEIDRPACRRWDPVSGAYSAEVVPPTPRVKLNTAYQAGGPLCVTRTVQGLSGLAVNHFLGVDFQGFKGMVDAVGGVRICVDRPIRDSVLGTVVDRAGPTVLSGDQALSFVRARHVEGDPTSDYGRIQRQQRFLGALLRETLSAGTLLDVGRLRDLVAAVGRSTFGDNVAADQLLVLGRSLGSVDPGAVAFTSVPTTGTANARGNEVLRPTDTQALFSAVIGNRPLPGQAGAAAPAAVPPDQVTVRLARAGDAEDDSGSAAVRRSGATREVAAALRGQGFRVVLDPTAAEPTPDDGTVTGTGTGTSAGRTVLRFSPDQAAAAATLGRSLRGATTSPVDGAGELALSLGSDVEGADGLVVAPAAVAPAPAAPVISAADAACA